jgi:steroid delta-isomerase-like uncharacterized protein
MTNAHTQAEQFFVVLESHRWDDFPTVMHDDIRMTSPIADVHSVAEFAEYGQGFVTAFPDAKHTITNLFQDGDKMALEGIMKATHTGPLAAPTGEVPPTGRAFTAPFSAIFRLRDGRVSEVNVYFDQLSMLAQLGLVPGPAAAG